MKTIVEIDISSYVGQNIKIVDIAEEVDKQDAVEWAELHIVTEKAEFPTYKLHMCMDNTAKAVSILKSVVRLIEARNSIAEANSNIREEYNNISEIEKRLESFAPKKTE